MTAVVSSPVAADGATGDGTPAPDVVVRRLGADEWAVLRDLRLESLADAPEAFASGLADQRAFTEQNWRSRLTPESIRLVAYVDGEPVGLCGGYLHDGVPELIAMWVRRSARGRGVAGLLVDGVRDWAVGRGADQLVLWVVDGNQPAERAYRRLGFVPTGARQPVPGRPTETESQLALSLTPETP